MGMKESPARKGNAASKGQLKTTNQNDKKIGQWKGGELGGDAGHSDKRLGQTEAKGAPRKTASKEKPADGRLAGSASRSGR